MLDVGTGTGALLPHILSYQPRRVVACDLSARMLDYAQQHYGQQVDFYQLDVVDLPPELGPFSVVFCNAVFANLLDQRATLRALHRLMTPGGRLVISHPMGRCFVDDLHLRDPKLVPHELPRGRQLRQLLTQTGFQLALARDEPLLYLVIAKRGPDHQALLHMSLVAH